MRVLPVTKNDLGIGKLRADLDRLRATRITVGWQGASGRRSHPNTDGVSIAQVGAWQEYGTAKAPARPALQTTFDVSGDAFRSAARKSVADVVDGRLDAEDAAPSLGTFAVKAVRETMDRSRDWAEPLAASTISRKGHDQPLLHTGTLRDAVSYAIREGGEIVEQGGEE